MSSCEDETLIEVLPEEILFEIFKWLDVESAKNASLVCRQWNWIIFSNSSIPRFCLALHTSILDTIIRETLVKNWDAYSKWSLRKRKQFRREVQYEEIQRIVKSHRCYRSLIWRQSLANVDVYLFKSLHPWKTEYLQTLEVDIKYYRLKKNIFKLLNSAIRCMPQLHSLKLLGLEYDVLEEDEHRVELHSKTVRDLLLNAVFPVVFDMPAIQTLTAVPRAIHQVAYNFPLENLKELTSENRYDHTDYVPHIDVFRRLTNLETVRFIDSIKEEEFLAICINFKLLKELVIQCELHISEARVFKQLTKLTNLRRLSLQSIQMRGTVICDFMKLFNLEYLNLGNMSVNHSLILSLPQSITTLELTITPQNERILLRVITSSLTRLMKLRLHLHKDDYEVDYIPVSTIRLLPRLTNLEEFEFSNVYFSKSCLLNMNAPLHRLGKLRFIRCILGTKHLKGLHDKFPKLNQLEFKRCNLKSGDTIEEECQWF